MSEDFCDVDFSDACDDAEQVQFYDARIVKGRKEHPCTECGQVIAAKVEHQRISYRFEGAFNVDRLCPACHEVAGEFEFNLIGGMLWESFYNEWDEGKRLQACLNRLTTAAGKEHMRQQWVRWHDLRARQRQAAIERRKSEGAVGQR